MKKLFLFLLLLLPGVVMAQHKVILITECNKIIYVIDIDDNGVRSAPIAYFEGSPKAAHELAKIMSLPDTLGTKIDMTTGLKRQCV